MLAVDQRLSEPRPAADNPLKICLLGYRSNPYSGGQGIYIRYLSRALVDAGHSVDVISGPPYPQLDERVRLIKLPSLDLFEEENHVTAIRPRHLLSFTDFFEWFSMLTGGFAEPYTFGRRLVKYFRTHQPQYDIIHDNQSLCYGVLQLQQMGLPVLTTIHHPITSDLRIALQHAEGWRAKLLIKRWHSFLRMQKKVVQQLDHLVTVSAASRTDISTDFEIAESQLSVVHNGIDTEIFKPLPDISRSDNTIMATASADQPLKGLEYLIRALAQLLPDYPTLKLVVIGKLREEGPTARLIDKLNVSDSISFHSGLSSEEIAEHYARATCAVVPSVYEGFGLPAGEAMACGVPLVSTTGGALPEVVGDAGITVPVKDPAALAAALKQLLDSPELRAQLGERGRQRILQHFSWQVAAENMVNLYHEVTV